MQLLWFCASGYSFFIGAALLIAAIAVSYSRGKVWTNAIAYFLVIVAVLLIFLSGTPLVWWLYILWATAIISWLAPVILDLSAKEKLSILTSILATLMSIIVILLELPFQLRPSLPSLSLERLYIIGDSVSAGIGNMEEQTYPKILRDRYGINVIDFSEAGATAESAMRQAIQVDAESALVLLEIGGNDILGQTPTQEFEEHLTQLLKAVSSQKRTVVMLELPLWPWQIKYGRVQRRLAKEFGIVLIPKRYFVRVLSTKGATSDLAHLTPVGHKLMAETIRQLLGKTLAASKRATVSKRVEILP